MKFRNLIRYGSAFLAALILMTVITYVTQPTHAYAASDEEVIEEDMAASNNRAAFTFVIDPGHGQHGGADGGAKRDTYIERDLNLKIALYLRDELKKYDNVRVFMTRTTAVSDFDTLDGIGPYAAKVNADALISIHNNSSYSSESNGSLVCVPNPNYDTKVYEEANGLAAAILKNLTALGLKNNGLLRRMTENGSTYPDGSLADYYSIVRQGKENHVPAIIVEHAFISNVSDCENYLSSDAKLKALAVADAKGIAEYYGLGKGGNGPVTINRGTDYSAVYNYDYYLAHNADVAKVYAGDPVGALLHFARYGMREGRQACADFNVSDYKYNYNDLKKAYGNDLPSYYKHYVAKGRYEGRVALGRIESDVDFRNVYKGVDYSPIYDYEYYIANNPDVKNAYGNDYTAAIEHFLRRGMSEYRKSCATFDVYSYKYKYQDLRLAFGNDSRKYFLHYLNRGRFEKRTATGVTSVQNPVTSLDGVDYSAIYDYKYYIEHNEDVKKAFGQDDIAVLRHFVNYGMREGRQASEKFDMQSYKYEYADLRSAFGNDNKKYYLHYLSHGIREKRHGAGTTELKGYKTVVNGVDYAAVYDFNYYLKNNTDVKAAYGYDDERVLLHFVNYGMREGRKAKESFDVRAYRNQNADLRKAFGADWKSYFLHYLRRGRYENRKTTGADTITDGITVYENVDYKAIYDYNYYINKYADLKEAFGTENDEVVLKHFVTHGLKEGRQAKANYDKNEYQRLREKAMENQSLYPIMGTTTTTAAQMAAYYKSIATYPAFYKNSDAPTIEDFCRIYIEECAMEGVKAEVAFCQAMNETGFLKYGGMVKIEQYNFAGMGATDGSNGSTVATFSSVREGIRAQVQHLKAYASKDALKNPCVDPRFGLVTRGSAVYLEWLGIQENPQGKGWASAKNYGYNLRNNYIAKLKTF